MVEHAYGPMVYMDDVIMVSLVESVIPNLWKQLNQDFALKDQAEMHYFIGIEVTKVKDGLVPT